MRLLFASSIYLLVAAGFYPASAQMPGQRPPADGAGASGARLERLEREVADLQSVVAAVETLAKNNSGGVSGYAAAAGGGASADQIRQLSEQLADLTQRIERLEARLGETGAAGPAPRPRQDYASTPASGFEDKQKLPPLGAAPPPAYGTRTQQNANAAPQVGYDNEPPAARTPPAGPATATAAATPRALFDQGYGALNRREYSAAEGYFQQFLEQYPSDALAGSAQYWLGESAFVSGEYKTAADRFLKTFTKYPTSERAPEALLKLAISLRRLGNNTDACATFSELAQRYPRAPQSVLQRADAEKKRANCS